MLDSELNEPDVRKSWKDLIGAKNEAGERAEREMGGKDENMKGLFERIRPNKY